MMLNEDFLALLACPCDGAALRQSGGELRCANGHSFPIVEGIPILLNPFVEQTTPAASASLHVREESADSLYIDTVHGSAKLRKAMLASPDDGALDPVVRYMIGPTSGYAYSGTAARATAYPVPDIPLSQGRGRRLLDVGAGWGRWSVSAARKGWKVIALDPSFGALAASQRVFAPEGLSIHYVCGDSRYLPVRDDALDCVFSYSVIQHLSKEDAVATFRRVARALRPGGAAKIQMPNRAGLRSTYHRMRRTDAENPFHVRYWSIEELRQTFSREVGPTSITAEAFGGLGLLPEDRELLRGRARFLVTMSGALRRAAGSLPFLVRVADSVYVEAIRGVDHEAGSFKPAAQARWMEAGRSPRPSSQV